MYGFYYDWTYIFILIGALICGIASINVQLTFKKYSKYGNYQKLTAEQVAEKILHSAGVYDVRIERINSNSLADHYSPKEKVLRLSNQVYGSTSVAAIGVAAHECGHAIQDKEEYSMLVLRSAAVPVANIGSYAWWPVFLLGLFLGRPVLAELGIVLFIFIVLFQLITVPVEFDASRRALDILERNNILVNEEHDGAKKVLKAAALTYVAALFNSILQLLRLILIVSGNGGKRKN